MIDCNEFLRLLVEEKGGKTPESRDEYEKHKSTCDDCEDLEPAYAEYEEAMKDPAPPDPEVRDAVMAYAETHIAMKNRKRAPKRFPFRKVWALAAVLLAGVLLAHQLGGPEKDDGHFSGQDAKTPFQRMVFAEDFHRQHQDDDARKYVLLVINDEKAPPELREKARKLLAELK